MIVFATFAGTDIDGDTGNPTEEGAILRDHRPPGGITTVPEGDCRPIYRPNIRRAKSKSRELYRRRFQGWFVETIDYTDRHLVETVIAGASKVVFRIKYKSRHFADGRIVNYDPIHNYR
jgi:hypothetical protein